MYIKLKVPRRDMFSVKIYFSKTELGFLSFLPTSALSDPGSTHETHFQQTYFSFHYSNNLFPLIERGEIVQ